MRIPSTHVSPRLQALFDLGQPVALRCFAVLDGSIAGQIWTDDPARPSWGAVQEAAFGTLFLCSGPETGVVHRLAEELRQTRDVVVGPWPGHEYNRLLPPSPDLNSLDLDFTDRPVGEGLAPYLYEHTAGQI